MTLFRSRVLPAALLFGATLLAFWPALHGGFIFDDNVFLTENPLIHAPDGLWRFWCTREAADYWPVTSSTLWLEWRLWGANATGYHVTNVLLHAVTVLLVWRLFVRLALPGAWVGALVYALHPLGAESVAWITERKNLLAMFFFVLALSAFVASEAVVRQPEDYVRRGRAGLNYAVSLGAFVLGMLSKSSVVVLPLVLSGFVLSRRRPTFRDTARLAPFFASAAVLAWVQMQFSTVLAAAPVAAPTWFERCLRAAGIVWFYLGKLLWPANFSFDYGAWAVRASDWRWWLPAVAAFFVTYLFWRYRNRGTRALLLGWGYLAAVLLPVMGFIEVGFMKYSPVSNHFAHLALLGFGALAGVGWAEAFRRATHQPRLALSGATFVAFGSLGLLTWRQATIFSDPFALYRDTIAHNSQSWLARTNLGVLLNDAGDSDAAIRQLQAAIRVRPDFARAHNDLGIAYYKANRLPEAVHEYEAAIRLEPALAEAYNNLGAAFARQGDLARAVRQFEAAIALSPDYAPAQQNLAKARSLLRGDGR